MSDRLRVLMAGPARGSAGGMYAVAAAIEKGLARRDAPVDLEVIDSGGGRGRQGYWAFPVALVRCAISRPDVLHLHVASKGSTVRKAALAAAGRAHGVPYVIHLHGGAYAQFLGDLPPAGRALVGQFFRGAAHVVVLGQRWRALVVDELGVPAARVTIVPNGVAETGPGEPGGTVLLFLGEVSRRKGADLLIEAAHRLLAGDAHPGWRLVLAGTTPEADLVEAARSGPAGERIEVTGPVFGPDKDALWRRASVCVLPSRAEALPMTILEGMAAGVPCVATDVGSIAEVIEDGRTGVLLARPDAGLLEAALSRLVDDPETRVAMGRSGRERWSREYTQEAMAGRVEQVWRRAAERGDGSRREGRGNRGRG